MVVLFHYLGFNFSIALHLTFFVALLSAGVAAFVLGPDLGRWRGAGVRRRLHFST